MQGVDKDKVKVCFANGAPVANNDVVITAGPWGPMLMEDIWHFEKMAHFNREVLPERRMHAKGGGAFGTLTVTHDITKYTKAKLFSKVGSKIPMVARFSTAGGERGAADAERDLRGFSLRFYTEEGNWDIVGNNTPVFFFKDPLKFPDLNHILHRDPRTNQRLEFTKWDFWSRLPEALHQVTILFSDRGIPKSFRHMHGFGSHTFSFINSESKRFWVKFHFITQQGIENYSDAEAETVIGKNRDSSIKDLYESIEAKDYPTWKFCIQIMNEEDAIKMPFNPFDLTKVWSHKEFPLIDVGIIELNRNPDNQFSDIECAGFTPANIVPGVGFSPDKMLQSRIFSYGDAIRYRLGSNHFLIPVNKPKCPFSTFHRDGLLRTDGNLGGILNYFPNGENVWHDHKELEDPPLRLYPEHRVKDSCPFVYAKHWDEMDDPYTQAGDLYRLLTSDKKQLLIENTVRSLIQASDEAQKLHIDNCTKADPAYGKSIADALAKLK